MALIQGIFKIIIHNKKLENYCGKAPSSRPALYNLNVQPKNQFLDITDFIISATAHKLNNHPESFI